MITANKASAMGQREILFIWPPLFVLCISGPWHFNFSVKELDKSGR